MESEIKPLKGILKHPKPEVNGESSSKKQSGGSSKKRGGENSKKKNTDSGRKHSVQTKDSKLRKAAKSGVLTKVGTPSTSKKDDPQGLNLLARKRVSYKFPENKFIPELFRQAKKNFRQVLPQLINKKHRNTILEILTLWQVEKLSEETQKNLLELSVCLAKNDEVRVEILRSKMARDNSLEMALYWGMVNELINDQIDFKPDYCKRQNTQPSTSSKRK